MKHRKITYAVYTDPGDREINEDRVLAINRQDAFCFVICDGLGGHGMGDVAAETAVSVFQDLFEKCEEYSSFLKDAFSAAQDIILAEQIERHAQKKMKTTCTALVVDAEQAYIGHVGDSRTYIFRKNKVFKRTLDHSIPQMLALTKDIRESEIRFHPQRNILLRVMGEKWEEPMQELMKPISLRKCQAFLLCSDGFWELIEETEMCRLLSEADSVETWLQQMAQVVKANGIGKNMDNNSAIAVWVE